MKRTLLIALSTVAAAFMLSSCLGHGSYVNNRSTNDSFSYSGFLADHQDSVFNKGFFYGTSNEFVFNVGVSSDDEKKVTAGFVVSAKKDRLLGGRGEKCNEYCVYDTSKVAANIFAVFYQDPDASLNAKEGLDIIFLGNKEAYCLPQKCLLANTGMVADMIVNGAEGFEPFKDGDYLRVRFTGYYDEKKGESVTLYLAQHKEGILSVLKGWNSFEIGKLGRISSIDINVETNREGLPLYFCLDDFSAKIDESY